MGYSYGQNERGRWVLACDACGTISGVRKRHCPHMVLLSSHRAVDGQRHELEWCPAPALCGPCFRQYGGTVGLHAACEAPARESTKLNDQEQARLDAGVLLLAAGWGDWYQAVPEGKVCAMFVNGEREAWYLIDQDEYRDRPVEPASAPEDFPSATPFHAITETPMEVV